MEGGMIETVIILQVLPLKRFGYMNLEQVYFVWLIVLLVFLDLQNI